MLYQANGGALAVAGSTARISSCLFYNCSAMQGIGGGGPIPVFCGMHAFNLFYDSRDAFSLVSYRDLTMTSRTWKTGLWISGFVFYPRYNAFEDQRLEVYRFRIWLSRCVLDKV